MQSNSSSENGITSTDTNLSTTTPFVCACRNKTFKSRSSDQTPSGGGAAPGNESGESAITIMAAATELALKIPPWNNSSENANLTCTSDDDLGLLELKLGNGVEARKSEASRNKKSYRHHPYDHKGWLSIGICGGSSSSGGSRSETASSERTISEPPNVIINHGENGVEEVCSSKANNYAIDNDDLDLKLGVKGYDDEVDLELRLKSWI